MGLDVVGESSLEVWRVRRGAPRMGVDFDEGALPAEAGVEDTIDITKGCFLGQESVAKIRNLGHPPHLLRHLSSEAAVAPGHAAVRWAPGGRDGDQRGGGSGWGHRRHRPGRMEVARVRS